MIALLLALALAEDGPPVAPEAVDGVRAIEVAQPFVLDEPEAYRMRGDHPLIARGWLARIEVRPELSRSRQIDQPVLYLGPWPARVLGRGEQHTCLVLWAPGDQPIEQTPAFFGSQELPERVSADRGEAELAAAVASGAKPLRPMKTVPALQASSLEDVWKTAQELLEGCPPR